MTIDHLVRTVLVAVLLTLGLLGAFAGAGRVAPGARVAAYAGFWAGVFLLGVLMISFGAARPLVGTVFRALHPVYDGLAGVAVGALVILGFGTQRHRRAVGLVFIVQTVVAGTGLILYFRIDDEAVRTGTALLTLGAAIGICLTFLVPGRLVARYHRRKRERDTARHRAREEGRGTQVDAEQERIERLAARYRRRTPWRTRFAGLWASIRGASR